MLSGSPYVGAAEDEPPVLTITGHLIDRIDSPREADNPEQIIRRYYAELAEPARDEANSLYRLLGGLAPDYRVAFAAADTAELNNVVSDIAACWAAIRNLHAREFTPAAIADLNTAYGRLYPMLTVD